MHERSLSINEVLRFANHDQMNDLQLISMHLQMGNVDGAFQQIEKIQSKVLQTSKLSKLQLRETVQWLLTAQWRFNAIQFTIVNDSTAKADEQIDQQIASYLEQTVIHVNKTFDPFVAQNCEILLQGESRFISTFHLKGKWNIKAAPQFLVHPHIDVELQQWSATEMKVIFKVKE